MSASATGLAPPRAASFWSTSNGKKAVMAVTGVGLAGFTLAHLAGNLQIFLGPDKFNSYALTLARIARTHLDRARGLDRRGDPARVEFA
jgi:succinate dehydrogenase / fumarate reductase cytochrome b subunit